MTDHQNSSAGIEHACAKFVMWCISEGSFMGCDINGGEAQDKAVELGLLDETTYDPGRHGPSDCCAKGDPWYVPKPELISLLTGAPAQPTVNMDELDRFIVRNALLRKAVEAARVALADGGIPPTPFVDEALRLINAALASQPSLAATVEELRASCRPLLGDVGSANDRAFERLIAKLFPPAATVETATKSAPPHSASQLAERAPSSDAAPGGADTQCSADTDHIDWDILAEERLGQRPVEHGRHIPQTSPAPGCDSGSYSAANEDAKRIPLADHAAIGCAVLSQPWEVQKAIVTIAAHCTCIMDEEPSGKVADLAGCISHCCKELADALHASVMNGEPQTVAWQPIETAPKDGTPVIIAERTDLSNGSTNWYIDTAVNYYEIDIRSKDVWFEREGSEVVCDEPTHWQPLPTPPVSRPHRGSAS